MEQMDDSIEVFQSQIKKLNQHLLLLWCYLQSEDMWDSAREYMDDHKDDDLPFNAQWII